MITVPTYIEKSGIEGYGLFAGRDIQMGEVIWLFDPNIDFMFEKEEFNNLLNSLSEENRQRIKDWAYRRGDFYIICGDNSNFWNHSETEANCGGPSPSYTIALRDIKIGEELIENYKDYCNDSQNIVGGLY